MKDFYTVEEIATLLRISPGTVRNRLSRGKAQLPPSVLVGRRRLFPRSSPAFAVNSLVGRGLRFCNSRTFFELRFEFVT